MKCESEGNFADEMPPLLVRLLVFSCAMFVLYHLALR